MHKDSLFLLSLFFCFIVLYHQRQPDVNAASRQTFQYELSRVNHTIETPTTKNRVLDRDLNCYGQSEHKQMLCFVSLRIYNYASEKCPRTFYKCYIFIGQLSQNWSAFPNAKKKRGPATEPSFDMSMNPDASCSER